jgi:hypothetical protein
VLLAALAVLEPLGATTLGLYFDPQGTTFERTQPATSSDTAWSLAVLGGDAAANGIAGAEFRLDNFPSDWFATPVANPAASLILGGPLAGGTNIAFDTCQIPGVPGTPVLLFTLNYFATSLRDQHVVRVLQHSTPSTPAFQCPLVVLCDAPVYTQLCVTGGLAAFNWPGFTAVTPSTWSALKSLYDH